MINEPTYNLIFPQAEKFPLNLLEVMEICSELFLTHLLAIEILNESREHFSELGESPLIILILSFGEQILSNRLRQIH